MLKRAIRPLKYEGEKTAALTTYANGILRPDISIAHLAAYFRKRLAKFCFAKRIVPPFFSQSVGACFDSREAHHTKPFECKPITADALTPAALLAHLPITPGVSVQPKSHAQKSAPRHQRPSAEGECASSPAAIRARRAQRRGDRGAGRHARRGSAPIVMMIVIPPMPGADDDAPAKQATEN